MLVKLIKKKKLATLLWFLYYEISQIINHVCKRMRKRNFKGKINDVVIIKIANHEIIILNLYSLPNFEGN